MWKYSVSILGRSEEEGAKIFMRDNNTSDGGDGDSGESKDEHHEKVVKFFNNYPKANLLYLEYLVTEKKSEVTCLFYATKKCKRKIEDISLFKQSFIVAFVKMIFFPFC